MKKLLILAALLTMALSSSALASDIEYHHYNDCGYRNSRSSDDGYYDGHHRHHCDSYDRYDYERGCRW